MYSLKVGGIDDYQQVARLRQKPQSSAPAKK